MFVLEMKKKFFLENGATMVSDTILDSAQFVL